MHPPDLPAFNNLRLAAAFAISGATSDPSAAFASGFTLWLGCRRSSDSHRLFVPATVPAINSQCPTGHQLKETLRPFNLWKQVQKTSKFVDFTRLGAKYQLCSSAAAICAHRLETSGFAHVCFSSHLHTNAEKLTGRIVVSDPWPVVSKCVATGGSSDGVAGFTKG